MTEQELMEEAKRLGYVCFKRKHKTWVPLKPCPVCGKKPLNWIFEGDEFYECPDGHLAGHDRRTNRQARISWNEEVERYGRSD